MLSLAGVANWSCYARGYSSSSHKSPTTATDSFEVVLIGNMKLEGRRIATDETSTYKEARYVDDSRSDGH